MQYKILILIEDSYSLTDHCNRDAEVGSSQPKLIFFYFFFKNYNIILSTKKEKKKELQYNLSKLINYLK